MFTKEYEISRMTVIMIVLFSCGVVSSLLAYHFATFYYHPIEYVPWSKGHMLVERQDIKVYPYKDYVLPTAIFAATCYVIPLAYTIKKSMKKIQTRKLNVSAYSA